MTITLEEIKKLREFVANELGRREDDCFEKSGPVWQSHVVPACEALSIVEKLPGMLEEYARLSEESALCENDPCWEYRYRAEAAERELATLREENDALATKVASLSPHVSCGCSYDKPDDLCMHHSPQLAAMTKRAEAAERERDTALANSRSFQAQRDEALKLHNEVVAERVTLQHALAKAQEQARVNCRSVENLIKANETLRAELTKAREALTPSAGTKAAYIGEFKFNVHDGYGDDSRDLYRSVDVPWMTIKEIMAAIRARAVLTSEETN